MKRSLPPGIYYVGDPGYVIQDDDWKKMCDMYEDTLNAGVFEFRGRLMFSKSTPDGDGIYQDQTGREYLVDSGLIGVVPIKLCDDSKLRDVRSNWLGDIRLFRDEFSCFRDSKGTFHIGRIRIKTR